MNVLILSAGQEPGDAEKPYPICLEEFDGVPLIEKIVNSANKISPKHLIASLHTEYINNFHLDRIVQLLCPTATIVSVKGATQGAACTALLALAEFDNSAELLITNGNEFLDIDYSLAVDKFRRDGVDAGVVTFRSIHPRYSYVCVDEADGLVIEASEKVPISKNATAGFYWFSSGELFTSAAQRMIVKDARVNDMFYICPALNELILAGKKIGFFPVDAKSYHPLKTNKQLEQYRRHLEREKFR